MHYKQADTLRTIVARDTIKDIVKPVVEQAVESEEMPSNTSATLEVVTNSVPHAQTIVQRKPEVVFIEPLVSLDSIQTDTIVKNTLVEVSKEPGEVPFSSFPNIARTDSTIVQLKSNKFSKNYFTPTSEYAEGRIIQFDNHIEKAWILGLALVSVILVLLVKIFFQKQYSLIISTITNSQLAEKLLREKNILMRRSYFILNLNFVISLSIYIYIFAKQANIISEISNGFLGFLYLSFIFIVVLLIRLLLLYFIGSVFASQALFKEYIHNSYLLNKNVGLFLLPLVVGYFYMKEPFAELAFYCSTFMIILSILYKYLRSVQIIMRHKVFLFYSIVYLCTLEILPVLIGIKYVLSLR